MKDALITKDLKYDGYDFKFEIKFPNVLDEEKRQLGRPMAIDKSKNKEYIFLQK